MKKDMVKNDNKTSQVWIKWISKGGGLSTGSNYFGLRLIAIRNPSCSHATTPLVPTHIHPIMLFANLT